jgi:putative ABC transport system substrate-binding protein
MNRREFIAGLGGAAAWPLAARAQQRKRIPVVGVLFLGRNQDFPQRAFRQGLADAGFVVGENIAIEFRRADTQSTIQLSALAADLVRRQVDVIFAAGPIGPIRAAKSATTTIPIVFLYGGDPVKDGLVASLARPGGNVTGVTGLQTELGNKRLGLLHELVPRATAIGFLTGPSQPRLDDGVLAGARTLGLDVIVVQTGSDHDFGRAFSTFAESGVGALVVDNNGVLFSNPGAIISLAERHKIPTIYPGASWVRGGGLISYGTNVQAGYRQAAAQYVGPILKGARPADMPVQQPVRFELALNLKTAMALGITVPVTLLAIADEVIENDPWKMVPTITVVSTAGDPRLPLVGDAVAFWNDTFAELGSPFRLGTLTQVIGAIPVEDLKTLSSFAVTPPESLKQTAGNIVVALSEGDFISFAARWAALDKAVVAIRDYHSFPLTLPNVARNVIAHELGQVIGLPHNADPTTLMCGRPASCRPDLFASDHPKYFPLTETEKAELRRMYPKSWQAAR